MAAFNRWLGAVNNAIQRSSGTELAELLALNHAGLNEALFEKRSHPHWEPTAACKDRLNPSRQQQQQPSWLPVVSAHCQAVMSNLNGDRAAAYQQEAAALTAFAGDFRHDSREWTAPVMRVLILNCKALAQAVDATAVNKGFELSCSSRLIEEIRKCYRNIPNAAHDDRKKIQLFLINMQLKLYFATNNLHLCKTIVRAMDNASFPDISTFPMAQQVTLHYYRGRLHIFNEEYAQAALKLEQAFSNCHPSAPQNRARILMYLLPVKMLIGQLPTRQLLEQYGMQQYSPILDAVCTGSIRTFDAAMEQHQYQYIQSGVYLLLEKLRNAVYRRLFKRVALTFKQSICPDPVGKGHQVPLRYFQAALAWQDEAVEYEEVECIVANLIFQNYVKGYIGHKQQTVVLSKANPFPPLSEIEQKDT